MINVLKSHKGKNKNQHNHNGNRVDATDPDDIETDGEVFSSPTQRRLAPTSTLEKEQRSSVSSNGSADSGISVARQRNRWEASDLHMSLMSCPKHPDHADFIPVNNLQPPDLPAPFQSWDYVELIRLKAMTTVKLLVSRTSEKRCESLAMKDVKTTIRYGSGTAFLFNMKNEETCTCRDGEVEHKVSGIFKVLTAAHTVYDDEEAQSACIEFSFPHATNGTTEIIRAWGVRVSDFSEEKNRSVIECRTHDLTLWARLEEALVKRERLIKEVLEPAAKTDQLVVIVSHPHAKSKQVSIGRLIELQKSDDPKTTKEGIKLVDCKMTYTAPTCPGSGGGSVHLLGGGMTCAAFAPHCASKDTNIGVSSTGWARIL